METRKTPARWCRWQVLIAAWIAILVVVAVLTYRLSNAHAEPGVVLISGTPDPAATIIMHTAEPSASPTAVSLAEVHGAVAAESKEDGSLLSASVAPVIVGAMLVVIFIATYQRRRT